MKDFNEKIVGRMIKEYNDYNPEKMKTKEIDPEYYALFIGKNEITTGDILDIGDRIYSILREHGLDYLIGDIS